MDNSHSRWHWLAAAVLGLATLPAVGSALSAQAAPGAADWPTFGWDVARSSAPTSATGITAANVSSLARQQVTIDGIVDATAIYLRGVRVNGAGHNTFFVTTIYGKTIAVDADTGAVLWQFTPPGADALAGSPQITNSTPVADPGREFIYAASPDGRVEKLAIADGHSTWSTAITKLPMREKIASPLSYFRGHIIAMTGGYIGDRPPYQGHVAVLDAANGQLLHVWNSLCSDRHELLDPPSCAQSLSAIWGRAGAVIDPATGNLFVATGNGPWDGRTSWSDAVLELDPDATTLIGNYAPTNTDELAARDADVGSTSPALLGGGILAQGGKDGTIRLLSIQSMRGATPHKGGELQVVPTPSGDRLFTAPAVLHAGGTTWLFAADGHGTEAWTVANGQLKDAWKAPTAGTSPVVAGGLLFVYDPAGGLRVFEAETGKLVATLESGAGHWNSPIVADGRIVLPEGNANRHAGPGIVDVWRLPKASK